jgi:hypothetical protein
MPPRRSSRRVGARLHDLFASAGRERGPGRGLSRPQPGMVATQQLDTPLTASDGFFTAELAARRLTLGAEPVTASPG